MIFYIYFLGVILSFIHGLISISSDENYNELIVPLIILSFFSWLAYFWFVLSDVIQFIKKEIKK